MYKNTEITIFFTVNHWIPNKNVTKNHSLLAFTAGKLWCVVNSMKKNTYLQTYPSNVLQFLVISVKKCAEIPKDAIESTDQLMEHEKITDKIDEMTEETSESDSGSMIKAIGVLSSKSETLPDM